MKKLKDIFGGDTRQFGMIFALVALIVFFQIMTNGLVLKPENVINIFNGNSYILVMAIGMVLVIIAGHIDLSVGSVAAAVGIVVALLMRDTGMHWVVAVLVGLVVGAIIGAWQGFWCPARGRTTAAANPSGAAAGFRVRGCRGPDPQPRESLPARRGSPRRVRRGRGRGGRPARGWGCR